MASISSLGIGSGLDLNGLLDQLEAGERQKLTPITTQQQSYQSKISAYGKLESALDKFQQAAAKLNDADSFRAVKSSVSGDNFTAAAGANAVAGTYKVSVGQLAQAHSLASQGVEDKTAKFGAAELSITVGEDDEQETLKISVAENKSSLEGIRDAINAKEGGVTASIINTGVEGESYRLVLTSKETGEAASIKSVSVVSGSDKLTDALSYSGGSIAQPETGMGQTVAAQNAELKVNEIDIISQSNRVEEAIQGVTLNLAKTNPDSTDTLTISQDNAAITKNIQSFVDAYNSLKSTMSSLTSYDAETGSAGQLLGDNTMRSVESNLRRIMSGSLGEGSLQMLSDVGIELKLDGTLEVNSEKLDELVTNSPESLNRFFGGDDNVDGFADNLDSMLKSMLDDKGLLDNATTGLEDRISSLDDRYDRVESSINSTIERYRKQFADMDMLVSEMNSTMTYLTQQFDAMNAQLGRD